jgi:mycothiol synthase
VNLRSPTVDEAGAVAALLNAHAQALTGTDHTSEEEIRLWFGNPELDLAQDVWVAVEDGALVAYADVADWGHSRTSFWIDVRAHPERGAQALPALIDRGEARVAEWTSESPKRERLTLRAMVEDADEVLRSVLDGRGYRPIRHSFQMEIELAEEPEEPSWPDGIEARRFARGDDARAVMDAVNDSFADTWDFVPDTYEEWTHFWFESETYDPDLWILAMDGEDIAGVSLCRTHRAGDPELGWVSSLGVRRPWRRRGLGRALLLESFRAFGARGLRRVGLGVDAENPTGATRLYESVGMRVSSRRAVYEKELRPAEPAR